MSFLFGIQIFTGFLEASSTRYTRRGVWTLTQEAEMPDPETETLEEFQARVAGMTKPTELKTMAVALYAEGLRFVQDLEELQQKLAAADQRITQLDSELESERQTNIQSEADLKAVRRGKIWRALLFFLVGTLLGVILLIGAQALLGWENPFNTGTPVVEGIPEVEEPKDDPPEELREPVTPAVEADSDSEKESTDAPTTTTVNIEKLTVIEQLDVHIVPMPRPRPEREYKPEARYSDGGYDPPHWKEGFERFHQTR